MTVDEAAEGLIEAITRDLGAMVEFPLSPIYPRAVARLIHELICHELQTGTNAPADAWQPIVTAPTQHGARFLTWSRDIGMVVCDRYKGAIVSAWNQCPYTAATHWRPTLEPPKT